MRRASLETRARSLRLRLAARELRLPSMHDLVPLDLMARSIFRKVYEERFGLRVSSRQNAHLDGLGYTIAALRPIYTYESTGQRLRPVSKQELSAGLFRHGAREMYFIDGRPTLSHLAAAADVAPAIIEALRAQLPEAL